MISSERDRTIPFTLAPLLVIAAAIRIAVNNVVAYSPADETVYLIYTRALAAGRGYPSIVRMFLDDRGMWVFPNPLRWSWLGATTLFSSISGECTHRTLATVSTIAGIVVVALTFWIATELFDSTVAIAASVLAATSPLQLALGRRALADEFFCAAALASLAAMLLYLSSESARARVAWLGAWIAATTITFAAKEQFLFIYPFVLLFWWLRSRKVGWRELAVWAAPPALFFAIYCLLARDAGSFFRIAHIITSEMRALYAVQYQSGMPQRMLLDLIALSPIATLVAIAAMTSVALRPGAYAPALRHVALLAAGILVVHALVPSQNVRYVVSVDPLLRILAAAFVVTEIGDRKWLAPALVVNAAVDLALFYVVFIAGQVYDPVTDSVLRALKMLPR